MGLVFGGVLQASSSGILPIAQGGTGANTASAAINNLLPSQTGNTNYFLKTDGSGTLSWAAGGGGGGSGTVTSVDVSGGTTGLSFSGGPVTTSGTITMAGTLAVANGGTGVTTSTGTGSVVLSNSPTLSGTLAVGTNISISNTEIGMNAQTLTQPLIKNYSLTTNALGNVSGSTTVNISLGNYVTATTTGATQWTFSNPPAGINAGGIILKLTNGGSATQTWPNGIKWPGGVAPTLTTSGVDMLVFITDDSGTTWRGVACMLDSK